MAENAIITETKLTLLTPVGVHRGGVSQAGFLRPGIPVLSETSPGQGLTSPAHRAMRPKRTPCCDISLSCVHSR